MQEGVMVCCSVSAKEKAEQSGSLTCAGLLRKPGAPEVIPMHKHGKEYINTLDAAKYAVMKMDSLHIKRAVVYAHNHQLARAVYGQAAAIYIKK